MQTQNDEKGSPERLDYDELTHVDFDINLADRIVNTKN